MSAAFLFRFLLRQPEPPLPLLTAGQLVAQGVPGPALLLDLLLRRRGLAPDPQDAVCLDADAPVLAGATPEDLVDRWLFAGNRPLVRSVRVGGRDVVADGRHVDHEAIVRRYGATVRRLLED